MPKPVASAAPVSSASELPFDSTLLFVLDEPISSKSSKAGTLIRVHLRSDLVVAGRVLAPAGTPGQVKIVDSSASAIMDTYGFVDIFFEPLTLPDGRSLPLRAPVGRLAPSVSSGHQSTVAAEDTAGDIFVPYYSLWQIFRSGKNFVLGSGSVIPARTRATLAAQRDGTIAIVTPHPLPQHGVVPNSAFPVLPMATPIESLDSSGHPDHRRPDRAPSPSPSPSPSPALSPSPSSAAPSSAAPSPSPSPSP